MSYKKSFILSIFLASTRFNSFLNAIGAYGKFRLLKRYRWNIFSYSRPGSSFFNESYIFSSRISLNLVNLAVSKGYFMKYS